MGLLIFKITAIAWMVLCFLITIKATMKLASDANNGIGIIEWLASGTMAWLLIGVIPVFICVMGWRLIS